jgi:hypothetical protein
VNILEGDFSQPDVIIGNAMDKYKSKAWEDWTNFWKIWIVRLSTPLFFPLFLVLLFPLFTSWFCLCFSTLLTPNVVAMVLLFWLCNAMGKCVRKHGKTAQTSG